MRSYHDKNVVYSITISFIIFLQIICFIYPIRAQEQNPVLQINPSFILTEYADDLGQKTNETSVNIDIPSSTWIMSSIDINFTSTKMNSETVTLEEDETGFETIHRNFFEILGMQLNISEQSTIFAVEIFGYKIEGSINPGPVYVRIEGWDSGNLRPNGIIYGEQIELNITHIPGWYIQTFNSPIILSPGYYCLVTDGSSLKSQDKFYWYINNQNPNSSLYMCMYDAEVGVWENRFGDVFLHKIMRRVDRSYHPEDINMTARINNKLYPVQNEGAIGKGRLTVTNLNFCPDCLNMNIFISNNISIELLLDYEYFICIYNCFLENATGIIHQDSNIQWILQPSITRFSSNHSLKFNFPKNWYNFSILRNGIDITSLVSLNYSSRLLYLPNSTIVNDIDWRFNANSPNIDFQLNVPKSIFGPQQDILFSIQDPVMPGNYTIILYNSLGFPIDTQHLQLPDDTNLYQYSLSTNPEAGIYQVFVFWNNATDAGLSIFEFQVKVPFIVPIEIIYGIVILISAVLILSFFSFILVRRTKRKTAERRKRFHNKYMDALNIDYFIVSDKNSGLCLYDQNVPGNKMDSSLISSFLQAIRSFGIELTKSKQESQTIKLEYHDSKIFMSEFKDFRLVFIMKDNPSEDFINSVDLLSRKIDDNFSKPLKNFDGGIDVFKGIRNILEKHLRISLLYPLRVERNKKINLTQNEKSIIERSLKILEERNSDYFYVSHLLEQKSKFQVKDAEDILKLIKKEIFIPIVVTPK